LKGGTDENDETLVNLPLLPRSSRAEAETKLHTALQAAKTFAPALVMLAVGFDALREDSSSDLHFTPSWSELHSLEAVRLSHRGTSALLICEKSLPMLFPAMARWLR
jgi:acetoin utilization deacetylase AcuC-like enzyme